MRYNKDVMLLLAAQLNYSWYRWKGAIAALYFALLLIASLMKQY